MSKSVLKRDVIVHRSALDRAFLFLKNYIKGNRKTVRNIVIGLVGSLIVVIIAIAVYESSVESNLNRYFSVKMGYSKALISKDEKKIDKSIEALKSFSEEFSAGIAPRLALYDLGNIFFENGKYKESIIYLSKFVNKYSGYLLPIAMNKIGIAYENAGNIDKAIGQFVAIEASSDKSVVEDSAYFSLMRLYHLKGNSVKSNLYYNKLLTTFPRSIYAYKAKKLKIFYSLKQK